MALIACRECGGQISEWAAICPHCGVAGQNGGLPVADVRIRFGSLVWLFVKAAIAAIPATIILTVIGAFLFGIFAAVIGR